MSNHLIERTVVLVLARAGSSLPGKHLAQLGAYKVIDHTLTDAIRTKCPVYLSSNDTNLLDYASTRPEIELIPRPDSLATPTSDAIRAVEHALSYVKEDGIEAIVVLGGSTVFREPGVIEKCADMLDSDAEYTSVQTVTRVPDLVYDDLVCMSSATGRTMRLGHVNTRQYSPAIFKLDGSCLVVRPDCVRALAAGGGDMRGTRPGYWRLRKPSLEIHTAADLEEARRRISDATK